MGVIRNLIDSQTSFLANTERTGIGQWVATNATLQRTSKRRKTGPASLLITGTSNGGTSTISSHSSSTAVEVTPAETYRGIVWFQHETVGRAVRVGIQFYDLNRTPLTFDSSYYVDKQQSFDDWTLAYVTVDAPVNARYAALRIELQNVNTSTNDRFLWIEDAALVTYGRIDSRFLNFMSNWIPDWMILEDFNQTNPQFPMMRFVELVASKMDDVIDLISDFDFIPESEGGLIGDTSSLVDPSNYNNPVYDKVTRAEWLPWLAQLVGVRSTSLNINSGTSWSYLEQTYPTWTSWETAINSAANTPLTISTLSRTDGTVTVATSAAHGLVAGDVVTIAGTSITSGAAADVSFNGYYEVLSASGSNFTYSQSYTIVSIIQSGTTTVTVRCGRPHGFVVGNTVTISGAEVAAFNGTFTVASVATSGDDGTDTFTYTAGSAATATSYSGSVRPSTNKNGTGGTATPADLKWSFIEDANAASANPTATLAEFIRTGAIGVRAGTIEGMKRAARIALSGVDLKCSIDRSAGTLTVTTLVPHGLSVSDAVTIYDSPKPALNRSYVVASVPSAYSFTLASGGTDFVDVRGWVTNKAVSLTKGFWNGTIDTVTVGASNAYVVALTQPFPATSFSGQVVIAGSAATAVNTTHTVTSPTVSSDRKTLTFTSNQATSPQSSAGGKIKIVCDSLCFVVGTTAAQTSGDQQIIDFVSKAKPAGAIITHEYTA